jgi:hypothetical protein
LSAARAVAGPINLTLAPFTVQEGLAYDGPIATFTSGNPLESAVEFAAQIDWGDGSPATAGIVSGTGGSFTVSGSHVYQTVGSYALAVTVIEPDGLEPRPSRNRPCRCRSTRDNIALPQYP